MTDSPSKSQLRDRLRQSRRELSHAAQDHAHKAASAHAITLPEWASAQHIAIYYATHGEVGTDDIVTHCHNAGISAYLPVLGPDMSMVFAQWCPGDELLRNRFGIYEPLPESPQCPVAAMDIIFLPLVGWDKFGGRLGMGAGYYDRALIGASGPLLVGLAHQMQEVEKIPQDSWDIPLDVIVTDVAIYHAGR